MRRQILPAVAAAALIGIGLAGCTTPSDDEAHAACDAPLAPGAVSDNIEVAGEFGTTPKDVTLPTEQSFSHSEATLLTKPASAESPRAEAGDLLTVDLSVVDGQTGDFVYQSKGYESEVGSDFLPVPEVDPEAPLSLGAALTCAAAGERYVIAFTAEESLSFAQSFGTTPGSSAIAIVDVKDVSNVADGGKTKSLPNGFPAVTTDEDGTPGVVLPPSEAPTETRVAERVVGNGDEINAEDTVIVQVLRVLWDGSIDMNGNWEVGPQLVGPEDSEQTPAWRSDVTGLKTGGMVVVLEPQSEQSQAAVTVVKLLAAG